MSTGTGSAEQAAVMVETHGIGVEQDRGRGRPVVFWVPGRLFLLGAAGLASLLTWWAWWYLLFTNYSGLVVSPDLEVVRILSDGPAARSGIQPGDRVLAVDGRPIANLTDYLSVMREPGLGGRAVGIEVERAGAKVPFTVGVKAYPAFHRTIFGPALGFLLLVFGLYVHLRKPQDPAAGLYLLLSTCLFVLLALSSHLARQTPSPILYLLWGAALIAVVPLNLQFYLVFPEPKACLIARPRILTTLYGPPALFAIFLVWIVARLEWALWRGLDSGPAFRQLGYLFLAYFVVGLLSCLGFVGSLVHSFLTASSAERKKQVEIILIGAVATLLLAGAAVYGLAIQLIDPHAASLWPAWTFDALYGVVVLATVILPMSMAVAILKYRLWDLESTIHASLIYMTIIVALGLVYFLILGILGWMFGRVVRPTSHVPLLVFIVTTGAVAEPLRRFVERVVDRAFNPEGHFHRRTLRDLSREITTIRNLEPLATRLCETLSRTLAPGRIAVLLKSEPEAWRIAASAGLEEEDKPRLLEAARIVEGISRASLANGSPLRAREVPALGEIAREAAIELAVPILHEGKLLGCLCLGRKGGEGPYTSEDRHTLETLANQLALAVANAAAFEQIQSLSRDREVHVAKVEGLNRDLQAQLAKNDEQKAEILRLQERLLGENRTLKDRVAGEFDFRSIVGAGHGLKRVMDTVEKAATTDATILILGETGTGKEIIARATHSHSARSKGQFVKVNAASLPEGLLQSELFGHEKGAFTGATERRLGWFEVAEKGTIFLDEIGDIPPATQLSLLRVLQEREFQRVGGRQTIKADVRVIAATNRDLERAVTEGRFRADLYYRLKVVTIEVPPLRERAEDIRELALHFLEKYARKHGRPIVGIDEAVIDRFKLYRWPGNVREMENVIEHAVVVSAGDVVTLEDIPILRLGEALPGPGPVSARSVGAFPPRRAHREELLEIERARLIEALEKAKGNRSEAARSLRLSRSTFYEKLKKHGLLGEVGL